MDIYSYSAVLNHLLTQLLDKISSAEDLQGTLNDHLDYVYGRGIAVIFNARSYIEIYQLEPPFDIEALEKLTRSSDPIAFVNVYHMDADLYDSYRKLLDTAANKKYRSYIINSLNTLLNKE